MEQNDSKNYLDWFKKANEDELNSIYIETRYPGDYPEFTWQEAEQAYQAAKRIKEFVLSKIV